LVVEITGLDVDVGRLDEEALECSDGWVASAAEERAGVLGAESLLVVTIFIFDRSRCKGF
jgi:hypothetical protein